MGYAVSKDGIGWRAVSDASEVDQNEDFSETQPQLTNAQIKAKKWEEIKFKRDAVSFGGVKIGAHCFHSDESSKTKYLGLIRKADSVIASGGSTNSNIQYNGNDIPWKTLDDGFVLMTVELAYSIFDAVVGLEFVAFAVANSHRVAMEASEDPAEYDFSAGWPETFGG